MGDDAGYGLERQPARREIDLTVWRHDVGLLAHVHDERFAVDANNGLQQRRDETHGTLD